MELTTMIRTNAKRVLMLGALASAGWACGSSATTGELSDARKAYDDAADSPAKTYRPGELTNAREALDRAEDAHQSDPGSKREARLATVAERKANNAKTDGEAAQRDAAAHQREVRAERAQERAEARAEQRADVRAEQRADVRADVKPEPQVARRNDTSADLAKTPDPIDKERVPEQPSNKLMETHQAQRDSRAAAALQGLSQVATVKEEPRGVVITMSGSLLFPSGQSELTPIARQNLDRVADAIAQQPDNPSVSIEGYTDAQGSADQNKRLSQKRAQAVANQLMARGVDKSRISVAGKGESAPVADNDSAEGRANNRRVEIVLGRGRRRAALSTARRLGPARRTPASACLGARGARRGRPCAMRVLGCAATRHAHRAVPDRHDHGRPRRQPRARRRRRAASRRRGRRAGDLSRADAGRVSRARPARSAGVRRRQPARARPSRERVAGARSRCWSASSIARRRAPRVLHNAAALVRGGAWCRSSTSACCPPTTCSTRTATSSPARAAALFELEGTRFGVTICEDAFNAVDGPLRMVYPRDPVAEPSAAGRARC